ncbi:hypothetical protein KIW84_023098 [Lathyrus oleraceus]|uniref:Uncharacterized protein n=1 Tax=Pisum sativum TaxID=3888 RepID=A0A9D4YDA4_PEA|nr:hypothetical protein KIW84_023098 [Pisum sativum]
MARFLQLPIEPAPGFNVLVGNGQSIMAEGQIPQLTIEVQGQVMVIPVFLLPFSGADIILGSSWLATLGPHVADYSTLSLKFFLNGKFIILSGITKPLPTSSEPVLELPPDLPPDLVQLLHHYHMIFQNPTALPPPRSQDHSIPLVDESIVVKVRPYRYPHSQKEQIEKMVEEMLNQGIIQPSISPFSSPIILVKKKDGTWRFCTDYRALNLDKADMEFNYLIFNLEDKVVFDEGGIARLQICEEGPQHAESENVTAQEGIKVVSDPEIMEARHGQRIKYLSKV